MNGEKSGMRGEKSGENGGNVCMDTPKGDPTLDHSAKVPSTPPNYLCKMTKVLNTRN